MERRELVRLAMRQGVEGAARMKTTDIIIQLRRLQAHRARM
jgi:hypothetical protein